jgi:hypothetical protein
VTAWSVLSGVWSFGRRCQFFLAANRTVDSRADLRWGPDGRGYRRLLHPNGVCLTGRWEITEATEYTGYFRQGSTGLVIGRYSPGGGVLRGSVRSPALVGKIYPTTDRNSSDRVIPASFFTQDDFGGSRAPYINDVALRNAPDTTVWRRGLPGFAILTLNGIVFTIADTNPTFRQVYEIAELGKSPGEPTRAPEFMRLRVDPDQPRVEGEGLDIRDEVLAQLYDRGDPRPKRELVFQIDVSDDGYTRGPAFYQRRVVSNWRRIGRIVFEEAIACYNGDFVVHFHHPAWRKDRNDPSSRARGPSAF